MKSQEISNLRKWIKKMILFFFIVTMLVISVLFYSRYIETRKLEVDEYRIIDERFVNIHGYKIAHVSDIHYGKTTDKEMLNKLIDKINLTKPDILLFTGDLIDKDTHLTEETIEEIEIILSKLNLSIKKYTISGEDDLKFSSYGFIMENAGFISLDDRYEKLYINQNDYILLTGLKSAKDDSDFDMKTQEVNDYLKELKETKPFYSILLLHEPDFIERVNTSDFDLILAGHSHGGQVKIPFIGGVIYPKYASNYHESYQKIGTSEFYISSGVGTTSYGFRLFNPPSFNFYRLVSY